MYDIIILLWSSIYETWSPTMIVPGYLSDEIVRYTILLGVYNIEYNIIIGTRLIGDFDDTPSF